MNLEAVYLYKDAIEGKKIESKDKDKTKLYSATIPYSLETIRMDEMFKNVFYMDNKKQYTNAIINITFDKNYKVWDNKQNKRITIANKKKIRTYLYDNGIVINDIKYVFYKRGAGKAKNGYVFFIQEHMRNKLLNRSRLDLTFEENEELDLTSLLAYESLVTSGLDDLIELNPNTEILLIDDIYGEKFKVKASVTREISGEIITKEESIEISNCLTDGQGLMDVSLFEKYNKGDKGFMLLRSDMFKCCAFNTRIADWFEYNNITEISDMFGNTYQAKDVKLITTPNSLKFLKFSYKIGDGSKKNGYNYWKANINNVFGVVKYDSEGNYGDYNRMTYQLLNSIPNLTYDELMSITKDEREYVDLLKNDDLVFKNYILANPESVAAFNKSVDEDSIESYDTVDLMNCLTMRNSDIMLTQKFKKLKANLISNYISNLKMGKFRIKNTKYVTIVSNPYEMLLAAIGKYENKSIMSGREVYCEYYEDNQEFCVTRNPHINAGNVMYGLNKDHEEYKWFHLTDNIGVVNFFDNDMPNRLQGCDTDSDTVMLIPNKILIEKAKYCEDNFSTPINMVEGEKKPRKYNTKELKKLDVLLSENYIGRIINMSQIINSYMNEASIKREPKNVIERLYHISSKLSSLSQIEIDKSKKIFDNVHMNKELKKITRTPGIRLKEELDKFDNMVDKMIVPKFFEFISESNDYRVFEKFDTSMDILQDVLIFKGGKRQKNVSFGELLVAPKDMGNFNYNQVAALHGIISKYGNTLSGLMTDNCKLREDAKANIRRSAKANAIIKLQGYKINQATVLNILRRSFKVTEDKFGFSKHAIATLNLLFEYNKVAVIGCFKEKSSKEDEILVKLATCNRDYLGQIYDIFGDNYGVFTLNEVKSKDFFK